ncbi:MAG: hypothetical protein KGH74_01750 [Candidatus Micrarchaeota archaeon]|nr:hypothetical protein [Candidatus Micrarchaeota archaeon]MDE1824003.1 hypothetical protein [Candidatus Micrarchaeota archaeon]
MTVLGIGDAHDSGAAAVERGAVTGAVNEERFTKNKNEFGFPYHSIRHIHSGNSSIDAVALAWIGGSALISRVFPGWGSYRRKLWRREVPKPSRVSMHLSNMAYRFIQNQRPRKAWELVGSYVGRNVTRKRLAHISHDLSAKRIYVVEHHMAHVASAYYTSGFKDALIITLDGAGDGLSGTVSIGESGSIRRLAEFKASASLGILYGAATLACDMRYGEDEGKLMSLAAYSYPKRLEELNRICRYDRQKKRLVSSIGTRSEFLLAEYMKDHLLSGNEREQFAYAVQAHVQEQVVGIVGQWVKETDIHDIAVAGGFFSNVITNMLIEHMPEVKRLFVFPHMGDGGLSLGAAARVDFMLNGRFNTKQISDAYFGPSYTNEQIEEAVTALARENPQDIEYDEIGNVAKYGAELLSENRILLWFQNAMEYGPRALGNRSVLALPSESINRDRINSIIKRRPYYQPFASTVLAEDASGLFDDYVGRNRFMTSANHVKEEYYGALVAASHVDHTTRPQTLEDENPVYRQLIQEVKKRSGVGAVLNTSLNKHGKPMVMSPHDALWTLMNTGADTLIIGDYVVRKVGQPGSAKEGMRRSAENRLAE